MSKKQKLDLKDFLTSPLRDEETTSIFSNLFNRFLSEEKSIHANGQIGTITDASKAVIAAPDLDRELNALVPALWYKTGVEEEAFTFDNLINKLKALGVNINNLRSMLGEKHFNFAPPINLDKFINFSNYYWTGKEAPLPVVNWNPTVEPEYYVIARPENTSTLKLPVNLATTRDIKLWGKDRPKEKVTVKFLSATTFTVTGNQGQVFSKVAETSGADSIGVKQLVARFGTVSPGLVTTVNVSAPNITDVAANGYGLDDESSDHDSLFSFAITAGTTPFAANDRFEIDIEYVTGNSSITFSGGLGEKGFVSNIVVDTGLMYIDGVKVQIGHKVLVCRQNISSENGIYTVTSGKWARSSDANKEEWLPTNSLIYVLGGSQAGYTFKLTHQSNTNFVLDDIAHGQIDIQVFDETQPPMINDWQAYNYWVHTNDLTHAQRAVGMQANRPIIEYDNNLVMNNFINPEGFPDKSIINIEESADKIGFYTQRKFRTNQLPQFDLFRYNGTHSNKTSGIFFFVEDADYPVDSVIGRRLKTTPNNDFIFGLGITDEDDRLLYYRITNSLTSVWAPGQTAGPGQISFTSASAAGKGQLTISLQNAVALETENFTVTALTASSFSVVGTRSGNLSNLNISTGLIIGSMTLNVIAGSSPFDVGDQFTFSIFGDTAPRYVKKVNGQIVTIHSDQVSDIESGTWLVSRRMFENLQRILKTEINYGDIIDHARSIIKNQDGFTGSSFGKNNYRTSAKNHGRGGLIREYDGNFPLLASMLIQKNISPLSVLDFGEKQYGAAISSIDQFLADELATFISGERAISTSTIDTNDDTVVRLLAYFERLRSENNNLKEVFGDSTAPIKNWPITLPLMGICPAVVPTIDFDIDLGINVIVHHDGHLSPVIESNSDFDKQLTQTIVKRSNGEFEPGLISLSAPTRPYSQQLWLAGNVLKRFDVVADTTNIPTGGAAGLFWYNRGANILKEWSTEQNTWVNSAATLAARWKVINTQAIRNSLVLAVEKKLYAAVHPTMQQKIDLSIFANDVDAAIELAKYSAKYEYDTFAPNYVAADAFTWNYSESSLTNSDITTARWFDIYRNYFRAFPGALETSRPDLEPWKLMGHAVKPAGWDSISDIWSYIRTNRPGIKLCVNPVTGKLLPPYVSAASASGIYALTNTIPSGKDAGYAFGQNGPVEQIWKKSLEFRYSLARVYFKKSPMEFLDKTWGYTYFSSSALPLRMERNLLRPLSPSKFLLHGEKLHIINARTITSADVRIGHSGTINVIVSHTENNKTYFNVYQNSVLLSIEEDAINDRGIPFNLGDAFIIAGNDITYIPSVTQKFLGLGQLFTNLLRYNYVDTDISEAVNAYRGWNLKLVHRIGALIRGDSLNIDAASITNLPSTAYSLLLKRSTNVDGKWISALRVQLIRTGAKEMNQYGIEIPSGNASDWVFRIENYNAAHPMVEYYTLNPNGDYVTFNALRKENSKLEWKQYTEKLNLVSQTMPITITGLQNVINFIYGYIARLNELGWTVNAGERIITDAETGRNLDWQLEVEKLIDRVYSRLNQGEGHILNPFMHGLWLKTPKGLMSRYSQQHFIDVESVQAAYDVAGSVIPVDDLLVIRTDEATATYPDTPIFSAHVFIDEFEHLIVFNNQISEDAGSTTLFDPFLGLRISGAMLSYTRQDDMDRKPKFDGFVLSGNDVTRNIVSSVDAIANYYDASKTFDEPSTAKHALALLGFNKKDYFSDIGTSDSTQFNFWRGLIQAKGTNMTIDAFTNYKKFTGASVDEHWAYKIAEYGDNRARSFPEVKIEVQDSLRYFTQLQFYNALDTDYVPLPQFTQIEQDDDTRWFSVDDLGKGLSFPAQPVEIVLSGTTVGYHQLSDILHNDTAPVIYLRTTTVDINNIVMSVVDKVATTAKIINASLVKIIADVPSTALVTHQYVIKGFTWLNPTKMSPIKLFDYKTSTLIKEIGLWHPAIGIHAYEPLDIVNSIAAADPALYNYSVQTTFNPNYVTTKAWGKREVGRVWWSTANLGYIPYYDASIFADRNERHARWGTLAEWASIDLYEWIESNVPPSEYDALAAEEEGRTDIDASKRASGKAARKTFYSRERIITTRPIAWSHSGVGSSAAHPAFGPSEYRLWNAGSSVFIDAGRVADAGLTVGRHLGEWKDNVPHSEVVLGNSVTWVIGSSDAFSTPIFELGGVITSAKIERHQNGKFGQKIGKITLAPFIFSEDIDLVQFIRVNIRMEDEFGFYEDVLLQNWTINQLNVQTLEFQNFGMNVIITREPGVYIVNTDLANALSQTWDDVFIREGINFDPIVNINDTMLLGDNRQVLVNDETDPDSLIFEFGWKVWDVPTQQDLNNDLLSPRNSWQPYMGSKSIEPATATTVAAMIQDGLVLKNGIEITRFNSSWTNWVPCKEVRLNRISDGQTATQFEKSEFTEDALDLNRISIYANGLLISPKNYIVQGDPGQEVIQIINTLSEGTSVLLIYRAFQPTEAELAFSSEVQDNPFIQVEYKVDYQYTKIDVRNETGSFIGSKYYFWIENSTSVRPNKSMSLIQAAKILTYGSSQFAMFERLDKYGAFDSCVIAGLSSQVTNNNSYKLRFLNDNTLRNDPEELALKNVHTEWVLIRRGQTSKIPAKLWNLITDTVAGQDANGNILPSRVRTDYDARNGTNYRFGFGSGQIFADSALVKASITNTILNTSLTIGDGTLAVPDVISNLDFSKSHLWFANPVAARATMSVIWTSARAKQINEIFFEVLEDALANNYELSDIFKTTYITVYSASVVKQQFEGELSDAQDFTPIIPTTPPPPLTAV